MGCKGRVLVTGASSGIGAAAARVLAPDAESLVLFGGRRPALLRRLGEELMADHGRELSVESQALDLNERSQRRAAIQRLEGPFDAVVCAAGASWPTPLEETLGQDPGVAFARLIDLNLTGVLELVRALWPLMNAGSTLVVVASTLAQAGAPLLGGYCSSKAGLVGLVQGLAGAGRRRGVRVHAVLPGWTDTPLARRTLGEQRSLGAALPTSDTLAEGLVARRFLDPQEVAATIAHLCSERGCGFTGGLWTLQG